MISKRYLRVFLIAFVCLSFQGMLASANDAFLSDTLELSLQSIIEKHRSSIPSRLQEDGPTGIAVALVYDNELIWAEGFGFTDRLNAKPVTTETLFSLQSISKTYTATAVMAALDDKKVSLSKPITEYLPNFTVNSRFAKRPEQKMTLGHLLSHYGGFPHEAPVGNNFYIANVSFAQHVESISDVWLRHPVGERYAYSNLGVDLAGHILEVEYQLPFERVMENLVLQPIGLERTTVDLAQIMSDEDRAVGHSEKHESVPVRIPILASGGVYASVNDMAKFMQFHLDEGRANGRNVIDKRTLRKMYATQMKKTGAGETYRLGITQAKLRYGETDLTLLGHSGGGFGFTSEMYWVPAVGMGVAVVANSDTNSGTSRIRSALIKEILTDLFGKSALSDENESEITDEVFPSKVRLRQIEGTYAGGNQKIDIAYKDGQLGWNFRGAFNPIKFRTDDEFSAAAKGMTLDCILNADDMRDPAWMDCSIEIAKLLRFSDSMYYDHGPSDPPGPNKREWQDYIGEYELVQWDTAIETYSVSIDNGYLTFNDMRIVKEREPGFFFLSNGEVLDLGDSSRHWSNRPLRKKSIQ